MLGQGHVESGRFAEAIPPLEKYLAGKPDGEVADFALAHLAHAQLELGRPDDARATVDDLATRFPKSKALPDDPAPAGRGGARRPSSTTARPSLFRLAAEGADPRLKARARSGLGWALLRLGQAGARPPTPSSRSSRTPPTTPSPPTPPSPGPGPSRPPSRSSRPCPPMRSSSPATPRADGRRPRRARPGAAARRGEAAGRGGRGVRQGRGRLSRRPRPPTSSSPSAAGPWSTPARRPRPTPSSSGSSRTSPTAPGPPTPGSTSPNRPSRPGSSTRSPRCSRRSSRRGRRPSRSLVQSSLYRLGRAQVERKDWKAAAATFDRLARDFPDGTYRREAALLAGRGRRSRPATPRRPSRASPP